MSATCEPERGPARVFIGLGSNLGDRAGHLREALEFLAGMPGVRLSRLSSCYETEPVGPVPQPSFLNMVAEIYTGLEPHALLDLLKAHERASGRTAGVRWGPRPIDLDILLYGELEVDEPALGIPHRELENRAFVLVPLAELEPELVIPGGRRSVSALLSGREDLDGVRFYSPAPVSLSGMM